MKNGIQDLRDHLFATLEALKDKDAPMDVERAAAISDVAGKIIDTARVEVDMVKALNQAGVTGRGRADEVPAAREPGDAGAGERCAAAAVNCLICGCSDHNACFDDIEGTCSWFVPFLCDFCVLGWMRPTYPQPLYEPIAVIA